MHRRVPVQDAALQGRGPAVFLAERVHWRLRGSRDAAAVARPAQRGRQQAGKCSDCARTEHCCCLWEGGVGHLPVLAARRRTVCIELYDHAAAGGPLFNVHASSHGGLVCGDANRLAARCAQAYWGLVGCALCLGALCSVGNTGIQIAVERKMTRLLCGEDSVALGRMNAGAWFPVRHTTPRHCTAPSEW